MTATPGLEPFIIGLLCGAVFGAAGVFSRRILGLIFGLAAAVIVFTVVDRGVGGLEVAVREVLHQALRHQHLVLGAALSVVLAGASLSRGRRRLQGGE